PCAGAPVPQRRTVRHRARQPEERCKACAALRTRSQPALSGLRRALWLYRQLAKADLIVIEDFGIAPLADETVRDSRWRSSRTATTRARPSFPAKLPLDQWHAYLGDRTVADAMLDRLDSRRRSPLRVSRSRFIR